MRILSVIPAMVGNVLGSAGSWWWWACCRPEKKKPTAPEFVHAAAGDAHSSVKLGLEHAKLNSLQDYDAAPGHGGRANYMGGLIPGMVSSSSAEFLWQEYFTEHTQWWGDGMEKEQPWMSLESRNGVCSRSRSGSRCDGAGSRGRKEEEVKLDTFDFIVRLKGCRDLKSGREIHARMIQSADEFPVHLTNTLMDMYVKCGSMVDAQLVFDNMRMVSVVSWNVMILGYAKQEQGGLALGLYARMQQEGFMPNDRTFIGALKACSSLATMEEGTEVDGKFVKMQCLEKGRVIHSQVNKGSFESDVFVGNTLIDMYTKCGSMVHARHVFDKLPRRTVVSWTAMILGCAEQGENEEAFRLYAKMQEQGPFPNSVTFVSILKACGNTAALETGKKIHAQICQVGLDTSDMVVATALVDMYGKCGRMVDAQQVFDALPKRDVVTWSALMAGYARHGESELVFHLFQRMRQEGVQPNGFTFLSLLTACSHGGLVCKGWDYFNTMIQDNAIRPTIEHYSCMVDLLGRAGQMDEAIDMVTNMPFQPNLVTWMSVLGASRKWNDKEVGRRAFEHVVRLDEKHAAAYVLLANIYADAHMWEDRSELYTRRETAGVFKQPGKSWWTEVGGKVHTFMVGDTKHAQRKEIYAKLKNLSIVMKEEGYVPDLDCVLRDISDDEKVDVLCGHSEKLAIACALINTAPKTPIRIVKNLRVCDDCHKVIALISKIENREIVCRDTSRFHVYNNGSCSCGDYW